jgi:hypothetical protein
MEWRGADDVGEECTTEIMEGERRNENEWRTVVDAYMGDIWNFVIIKTRFCYFAIILSVFTILPLRNMPHLLECHLGV